jgi:hypothetical protein
MSLLAIIIKCARNYFFISIAKDLERLNCSNEGTNVQTGLLVRFSVTLRTIRAAEQYFFVNFAVD